MTWPVLISTRVSLASSEGKEKEAVSQGTVGRERVVKWSGLFTFLGRIWSGGSRF